jgi:hypothetical protein
MFNTSGLLAKIVAIQIVFIPVASFADDDTELNATFGRANVFLDRALEGLKKLEPGKSKISQEWASQLQDKAGEICQFIKNELEKTHRGDPEVEALCSVE